MSNMILNDQHDGWTTLQMDDQHDNEWSTFHTDDQHDAGWQTYHNRCITTMMADQQKKKLFHTV